GFFGQSSLAGYALTTADNTVVVDPDVDPVLAAPLGCGFQTGAGAVLNLLRPRPGSAFVVFGAGAVGLAGLLAALAADVETVIVVEPSPQRRA
ncbi:NAD(P)-dependent alcohol dehydrogenase, partial [Mycobacterium sp. ITM-2017-0098]